MRFDEVVTKLLGRMPVMPGFRFVPEAIVPGRVKR